MIKKLLILILFTTLIVGCSTSKLEEGNYSKVIQETENLEKELTFEEEIIKIIKENKDGKDYYETYPNANIVSIEKKSYQELLNESKNTNYPGLYRNLTSSDSLYEVRVNGGKNLELLAIVNYQEKEVVNIIGLYLVSMG